MSGCTKVNPNDRPFCTEHPEALASTGVPGAISTQEYQGTLSHVQSKLTEKTSEVLRELCLLSSLQMCTHPPVVKDT
jgi:hypothetical protein